MPSPDTGDKFFITFHRPALRPRPSGLIVAGSIVALAGLSWLGRSFPLHLAPFSAYSPSHHINAGEHRCTYLVSMKAAKTARRGRKSPAARTIPAADRPSRRQSSSPANAPKTARSSRRTPNTTAQPGRKPKPARVRKPAWKVPALLLEGDPLPAPAEKPPILLDPLLRPMGVIDMPIEGAEPEPMPAGTAALSVSAVPFDSALPLTLVRGDLKMDADRATEDSAAGDNVPPQLSSTAALAFPASEIPAATESAFQLATIPIDPDIYLSGTTAAVEGRPLATLTARMNPQCACALPPPGTEHPPAAIPPQHVSGRPSAERQDGVQDLVSRLFEPEQRGSVCARASEEYTSIPPATGTAPGETVSSPTAGLGPPSQPAGFWFSLNAELVVYGATERDARVVIGGRLVPLRPDGTFTLRYALPDGHHDLTATAASASGAESRSVQMHFSRATHYCGQVESLPPSPDLATPS